MNRQTQTLQQKPTLKSGASDLLQRSCACGNHTIGGTTCLSCQQQSSGSNWKHVGISANQELVSSSPTGIELSYAAVPARAMDQVDAGTAPPVAPNPVTPQQGRGAAPVACAHPTNWQHTTASDSGPDGIQIPISWESSTGNLADLGSCTVREVVSYDAIPNPPFLWNPPNPTTLTVPAINGSGQDTHSYPPGLASGLTTPRQAGTMTAHQVYQYRCTGPGCSSNWESIPGQAYTITRAVFQRLVSMQPWRYSITKTGGSMFSYSREVPVP
jgi:hypothetical protein